MIRGQGNGGLGVRASLLFVVLVVVARLASGQPGAVDMSYLARLHGDQLVQSAPLRIREYSRLHGGAFRLQISGTPAANLSVLRSTDLTDWQVLGVGVETEPGLFEFIDEDAPVSGSRFYQARAE